jgi:hypothetical protein
VVSGCNQEGEQGLQATREDGNASSWHYWHPWKSKVRFDTVERRKGYGERMLTRCVLVLKGAETSVCSASEVLAIEHDFGPV